MHSFSSNLSHLRLLKLDKSEALRPRSLLRTRDAQFFNLSKLSKELFQLTLIKAFWQVANIDNAFFIRVSHF